MNYCVKYIYVLYIFYIETLLRTLQTEQIRMTYIVNVRIKSLLGVFGKKARVMTKMHANNVFLLSLSLLLLLLFFFFLIVILYFICE